MRQLAFLSSRHSFLAAVALTVAALASLSSACGDEEEPPAPTASVFFIHHNSEFGNAEIKSADKLLVTLAENQQTDPIKVPTGSSTFALHHAGASASTATVTVELQAQTYLFVVTGTNAEPAFWSIDTPAPSVPAGMAALEVVNLFAPANGQKFDVYAGGTSVATSVEPMTASEFVEVQTGKVTVELYNEGDTAGTDFAFDDIEVDLADGGSYMLIFRNADGQSKPSKSLVRVK